MSWKNRLKKGLEPLQERVERVLRFNGSRFYNEYYKENFTKKDVEDLILVFQKDLDEDPDDESAEISIKLLKEIL